MNRKTEMNKKQSGSRIIYNTGCIEWYTPLDYINAVREVMGDIDLDPASCIEANTIVKAKKYFTKEENGLLQNWFGRVFMNPPYKRGLISKFTDKLIKELVNGNVKEAIVLVNNSTETKWFQNTSKYSSAICLVKGRIKFINEKNVLVGTPLQGQIFMYFGNNNIKFYEIFKKFGTVFVPFRI